MHFKRWYPIVVLIMLLCGCTFWKSKEIPRNSPEALYLKGYEDFQKGNYEKAIESFQRLKEEYPLSELSIRAELGVADANYSREEYGYAEMAYNDFVNLHPTNENLPYAMYQIGMCNYKLLLSIDRDQTNTLKALKEFEKLKARFPSSKFSFLAEKKIKECQQLIAEHEFYVGELYLRMKQYKAALNRFENIARNYSHLGLDYKVNFVIEQAKKQMLKTNK